jgi:nickel-type superoxide dismutase maturation protease
MAGLIALTAVALGAVLSLRPRRVAVEGASMRPSLEPGDRLVVLKLGAPHVGDVVALHDPDDPGRLLVKRVAASGQHGFVVLGDNAAQSRDSRRFGPVPASSVIGKAVYRYFPAARAGSLRRLGQSGGTLGADGPASG